MKEDKALLSERGLIYKQTGKLITGKRVRITIEELP